MVASASAQFAYPYHYGYAPFAPFAPFAPVAPVAPVAKYTVKTAFLEADKDAKTPAATTFLGAKEYKHDVYTPLAYSYPFAYPVVAAAQPEKKVESSRKKRQVPVFPYHAAGFYHYAPAVAKYQVKTVVAEADESAKTPASTTKFDTKVVTKEFTAPVATPVAAPVVAAPYAYGYSHPFATYPFAPAVFAAPVAEKKVESSRKKRQVFVVPKPSQFYNDLVYKSVDLNQDGQPDKAAVVTSYAIPYTYAPYGYPFYG